MGTAELVDLMMDLVIYPSVVIMYTIVEQGLIDIVLFETVNNLKAC